MGKPVVVLGIFACDLTFRSARLPRIGETILGNSFALGPGGKGSNQAVALGRLGADVTFLTRLGMDTFAEVGKSVWRDAGVKADIIVAPGEASLITP